MKEDVSFVNGVGERRGEVGFAVKVVMVIMTSDGDPTGVTRRLGTGEIIFCSVLSSTRIVEGLLYIQSILVVHTHIFNS